jgi:hypothetical protein
MKERLIERFTSRAFIATVGTAVAAWATGNGQEAIWLVLAYVVGDRSLGIVQAIRTATK